MRISACMIVKDEEELLGGCLESIVNFVDEIIIVDTGSTDKTIEIAKSFEKVKLFKQKWKNDFSRARNYSIDKAKGDWFFQIDADERLREGSSEGLKKLLQNTKADVISLAVYNHYKDSPSTFLNSNRILRASKNLRYKGIVHNQLVFDQPLVQEVSSFQIDHLGYDLSEEKMRKKFERTRDLLEKQLDENPDDPYALMNMATLYRTKDGRFSIGCAEPILEACERAADLTDPRRVPYYCVHLQAMDLAGWVNFYTGKVDDAISWGMSVLKLKDNFLDTIFLMGFCHYEKSLYDKAFFWFNRYLAVHSKYDPAKEYDSVIVNYLDRQPECFTWMGKSSWKEGKNDRAVNCLLTALKLKPTMHEAFETLEVMYSQGLINDMEMKLATDNYKGKEELPASYYDAIFAKGQNIKMYDDIHKSICALVFSKKERVLEIGCGSGVLAKKLIHLGIKYRGFDFSEKAIDRAGLTNVSVGNIYDPKQFKGSYDTVIATEVLEHVNDLKVLTLIPEGKRVILTVPNYEDPAHLRVYVTPFLIKERFDHLIDIKNIQEFHQDKLGKIFLIDAIKKAPIKKGVKDAVEEERLQV